MSDLRIVSLLPAATEMVFTLGLGDHLVGVSHECDFPAAARGKPIVVRPALTLEKMSLQEIDRAVSERLHRGKSLYQVDEKLLQELKPDLILTQNLCQVCAPSGNELSVALKSLEPRPKVLWMSPHSLEEINQNIRDLGETTGRLKEAEAWIASGRKRLEEIEARMQNKSHRARAFCLEWADPVYCAGHWVPEMVELAGGVDGLARKGTDSVRIEWEEVLKWAPEVLILSPCGFHLEEALEQIFYLESRTGWAELPAVREGRVYAVDASSYFARPGPRIIDGTQLLAHLIHPELADWQGPANAFLRVQRNSSSLAVRIKICPTCGRSFQCKTSACWCNDFPPLPPSRLFDADCLCPDCLAAKVERSPTRNYGL
jgi:iron complex transport system substrate-binding protein